MKAFALTRYGPAHRAFELREYPDLEAQPGTVRIAVEAFGLNFADVMARLGLYPDAPKLPGVLGYDVVGRVDQVGAGVADVKLGDRVVALTRFGGYATQILAARPSFARIPASWSAADATALATQYSTAYYCAEEMVRIHPGDHVLVHAAAGGVGMALVQFAKASGAIVYGTAGSDEKCKLVRSLGANHAINYRTTDFAVKCREIAGSHGGMDIIFDSLGGSTLRKGMKLLRAGGRLVGFGAAEIASPKRNPLKAAKGMASFGIYHPVSLLSTARSLIGVNMLQIADHSPEVIARCLKGVIQKVEKGVLKIGQAKTYPSTALAEAHEFLASRQSHGKLAILWS